MAMKDQFKKQFGFTAEKHAEIVAYLKTLKAQGKTDPDVVAAELKARFPDIKNQVFPVIFAPLPASL